MTRVVGEPALVLHARPYRETSAIVSLLTASHGRVAVVARGVRSGKRGNAVQAFNLLRVNWIGRGPLYTLTGWELMRHAWLSGNALAAGFYLLELLTRVLPEQEAAPALFAATCGSLEHLQADDVALDVVLRRFEKLLLEELGYGIDFCRDADSGEPIRADGQYALYPDAGFVATSRGYPGTALADIAADKYDGRATRVAAKKIFRQALKPLLGPRPLASRRLLTRQRA
ncbi:MAG: DNA repair protein RecO [Pseudomonadales bacterium]